MGRISFREFMAMDPEQREADAVRSMWNAIEQSVKEIARGRRVAEMMHGISNEVFDEKLNEMCSVYNEKYCDMNESVMAMDMLSDLMQHCDPEELAEDFVDIVETL